MSVWVKNLRYVVDYKGTNGKRHSCRARQGIRFCLLLKTVRTSDGTVELVYFYLILVIMLIQRAGKSPECS